MRVRAHARRLALLAAAALCLVPWRGTAAPPEGGFATRLIGPVASLGASIEWILFDLDAYEGRHEAAYVHAERALRLDPGAPVGWTQLAHHLMYERGSGQNERDPRERVRWLRAGLDLLERGEARCREPERLALVRGQTLCVFVAGLITVDPEDPLPWPGGLPAALEEGRTALERARDAGLAPAAPLLHQIDHRWPRVPGR